MGESAVTLEIAPWSAAPKLIEQVRRLDKQTFSAGTRIDVAEEIARPYARGWVARRAGDDRLLGYLATWHVADELQILNIATDQAARRQGVARTLLKEAMSYARGHGVVLILLEVRRGNLPAIGLYRGFGFFVSGLRPRYYQDNQEDAVELMLRLDPETGTVIPGTDDPPLEPMTP